ncbi:hypothetical protein [Streptomyces sirii]|uniref:hypothetical protein n=1 Tax=Streptomyces sirii TaxID=3127701 RepID=UPI003D35F9D6
MRLHSHDDFTPLKEVIVGSAANYLGHDRDLSFELFHHENIQGFRSDWAYPRLAKAGTGTRGENWAVKQRYVEELHEDVEALAAALAALAGLGVTVHRPLPLPTDAPRIAGLGWEAAPTPR